MKYYSIFLSQEGSFILREGFKKLFQHFSLLSEYTVLLHILTLVLLDNLLLG